MKVKESTIYCSQCNILKNVCCVVSLEEMLNKAQNHTRPCPHWKGSQELLPPPPRGGALLKATETTVSLQRLLVIFDTMRIS